MPDIRTDIGPAALPATGGSDGFGGFGRSFLTDGVGRGQANKPDDVLQASAFLAENGVLNQPTRTAGEDFLRGIEKGQERLNQLAGGGLHVDGIAKPWGPTEVLSQRAVTAGKMKAPRLDGESEIDAGGHTTAAISEPAINMSAKALKSDAEKKPSRGPASMILAQTRPARPNPPVVPSYRKQVFNNRQDEWRDQYDAFGRISGVTDAELRTYMEIFAAEGGSKVNPVNGATAGITRTTLNDLIDRGKVAGIPRNSAPRLLNNDQRANIFRAYMDDALGLAGGIRSLDSLGNIESTAAVGDTLFRHGRTGGGEIIQRALDKSVPGGFKGKGPIGPQAFPVIKKVVADPNTRQPFLDALAAERKEAAINEEMQRNRVDRQTAIGAVRGEFARFDHFRFQKAFQKSP
jgi:hypothetical protein